MGAVVEEEDDVDFTGDWVVGVNGRDVGRTFSFAFPIDFWFFLDDANKVPSYVTLLISIVTTNSGSPLSENPTKIGND